MLRVDGYTVRNPKLISDHISGSGTGPQLNTKPVHVHRNLHFFATDMWTASWFNLAVINNQHKRHQKCWVPLCRNIYTVENIMSNNPWPNCLYSENGLEINSVRSWILKYVCIVKFTFITGLSLLKFSSNVKTISAASTTSTAEVLVPAVLPYSWP